MSEPILLTPVESALVRLASAEKARVLAQVEQDFAANLRPIFKAHGIAGDVRFAETDAGITMQVIE